MRVINFDKGSKRRLRQIRWKQREIVSAILLFLLLMALAVWLALAQKYRAAPPQAPRFTETLLRRLAFVRIYDWLD